ncbi:HU domain-containing protein [Pedobacter nyackensis]|uniref:Sporulation related domain-containing protein n=1 Tax=Pedobacter nyackensis TaxID=475255 RepID=A0A1W1ZST8_9SPHI|nr:SPOR domain-containing protein [Pedobacter nyackensis]SMC51292.1 Sporulation related domain-containing protein [Pedobacter nyackensis]
MDILSYLTTLIKTHKEVGIPGLGTIYKMKSPGRYDIDTHSFLPPSYSLSFTSDLREQSLLTDLISKKKNISTDAATYFVEQFSQNILDELSGHQESDFGELGTFSTASGSLAFIPKQDSSFGFDFYGLPTLNAELKSEDAEVLNEEPLQTEESIEEELPVEEEQFFQEELPHVTAEQLELENNNADLGDGTSEETTEAVDEQAAEEIHHLDSTEVPTTKEDEDNNDEQPVFEEIAEVVSVPEVPTSPLAPVIETPEPLNDVYETVNIFNKTPSEQPPHLTLDYTEAEKSGMPAYMKVIIGLAAIIMLAGVIYMAKPELFDSILKKESVQPVEMPDTTATSQNDEQIKIDSITQADSIRRSNEKAILAADSAKDSIKTIKPIEKPIEVTAEKTKDATVSYEIIAASLLNQKEANNFLADMKKKGIPAKIANMPGKRVKISIGSFADEETAKKELEILKKTTKIPGIYIYSVRHTNNPK